MTTREDREAAVLLAQLLDEIADPPATRVEALFAAHREAAVAAERERVAKMGILADSDALATVIGELENYTLNGSNAPAQIRGIYADLENATKLIRAERERTRVLAKEWRERADVLEDRARRCTDFYGDPDADYRAIALRECADALEGKP